MLRIPGLGVKAVNRIIGACRYKTLRLEDVGKRRLHQSPTAKEIDVCRWWLEGERALVKPKLILALGTSAARAVAGRFAELAG